MLFTTGQPLGVVSLWKYWPRQYLPEWSHCCQPSSIQPLLYPNSAKLVGLPLTMREVSTRPSMARSIKG